MECPFDTDTDTDVYPTRKGFLYFIMKFMLLWLPVVVIDNNCLGASSIWFEIRQLEIMANNKGYTLSSLHLQEVLHPCVSTNKNQECCVLENGHDRRKKICYLMDTINEIICIHCNEEQTTKARIKKFEHKEDFLNQHSKKILNQYSKEIVNQRTKENLKQQKEQIEIKSAFWSDFKILKHFSAWTFNTYKTIFHFNVPYSDSHNDRLLHKAKDYFTKLFNTLWSNTEHESYTFVHPMFNEVFLLLIVFFAFNKRLYKNGLMLKCDTSECKTKIIEDESKQCINKCHGSNLKTISETAEDEKKDNENIENNVFSHGSILLGDKVSEDSVYIKNFSKFKSSFEVMVLNIFEERHQRVENVTDMEFLFHNMKTCEFFEPTEIIEGLHTCQSIKDGVFLLSFFIFSKTECNPELLKKAKYSRKREIIEHSKIPKANVSTEFSVKKKRKKSKSFQIHSCQKMKNSFIRSKSKCSLKKKKKKKKIVNRKYTKCVPILRCKVKNGKTIKMVSINKEIAKQNETNADLYEKEKEYTQKDNYQGISTLLENSSKLTKNKEGQQSCDIIQNKPKTVLQKEVPVLLEIRGLAADTEHDALINEVAERFASNMEEKTKNSPDKSDKKIVMVEKESQKDKKTHLNKQKDFSKEQKSLSWLLQWKPHSKPFATNPLFVYPISQYFERFATFSTWPMDAPISAIRLCEAGFHYKGIAQVVECSTCKLQVSRWNPGDIPIEIHQKRSPQCNFLITNGHIVKQNETSEQSIQVKPYVPVVPEYHIDTVEDGIPAGATGYTSDLTNQFMTSMSISENPQPAVFEMTQETSFQMENNNFELDSTTFKNPDYSTIKARLESFISWQLSDKQNPSALVDAGLYYIGKNDIVRCFCCDIGLADWESEDDPWTEHARHSPNCAYVIRERGQEFIDRIQESWRRIYSPKHPHLADYHRRLQTFASWPSDIQQRPPDLCQAGFFYTQEEDVVRCHYCDGGLRQWEPGDDPWTEHARWFPFCKYIVKIKGLAFIETVARTYNEMYISDIPDDQLLTTDNSSDFFGMYSTNSLLQGSQSADPVGFVLSRGYSLDNAMMAIQQFTQFNNGSNRRRFTGTDLLNIIQERERLGDVIPEAISNPVVSGQTINNQPSRALAAMASEQRKDEEQLDDKALAEKNRQLKNQLICITCQSRESTIVLTPCGHRVLCDSCSENLVRCPKCNVKIQNKIKSFLA